MKTPSMGSMYLPRRYREDMMRLFRISCYLAIERTIRQLFAYVREACSPNSTAL